MTRAMYVHVPFCKDICSYCDFTRCGYYAPLADKWLDRLQMELESKQIDPLKTLYIGGGTPSALQTSQLTRLFQLLSPYTKKVEEYTIEVNADSLTDDKIKLCKAYGVNRVSMGAQTFQEKLLKIIARKTDFTMIQNRIQALHAAGITNISLDLMYGLPTQTLTMWEKDLSLAMRLPISHISLYSLTIEPNSAFGRKNIQPCDLELESDMYETAIQRLSAGGFDQYEISNFAKAKKRSLHNQMYWHYEDFYGIGCGASGKEHHTRYENTRNLQTYLKEGSTPEVLTLSQADEMFEMMMMSLRLCEGICEQAFKERFHVSLWDVYGDIIEQKIKKGQLVHEDGFLHTTYQGMLLLNDILLDFLP